MLVVVEDILERGSKLIRCSSLSLPLTGLSVLLPSSLLQPVVSNFTSGIESSTGIEWHGAGRDDGMQQDETMA